jgi:hypothetical protein
MNCMIRMEGRLVKTGRMEEFTKQFQDNIDREVFRRTFKEELNPLVTARPYRDVVSFVNMFF